MTRAHVIAWRDDLHTHALSAATIRRHLVSLSSLFNYLCEKNAVTHNPVDGVKRPPSRATMADPGARRCPSAATVRFPAGESLKDRRDCALLATLLYHGLRRDELCKLRVKDAKQQWRGALHLKISGKGCKTRFVPLHPAASRLLADYLEAAGHGDDDSEALFRPLHHSRGDSESGITPDGVYKLVRDYSTMLGFTVGAHSLRSAAATNALEHGADLAEVQQMLGHANIATTRLYDQRDSARNRVRCSKCAIEWSADE